MEVLVACPVCGLVQRVQALLPAARSYVGLMPEAERIAELATPFLDDLGPPRPTDFFQGVDTPSGRRPAPATAGSN